MTRLADIPVVAQGGGPGCGVAAADTVGLLGGGVTAILGELAQLLMRLGADDEPGAVDLRGLPMTPRERMELWELLGEGEVRATVAAAGLSQIRETGVAGVWWVEHRDAEGVLRSELLEVCRVPQILARARDEVAAAGRELRGRLNMGIRES